MGIALLICVGLSGCNEQQAPIVPPHEEVTFSNLRVITKWNSGSVSDFYHDYPSTATGVHYELTGYMKNNASIPIDEVQFYVMFKDGAGVKLSEEVA